MSRTILVTTTFVVGIVVGLVISTYQFTASYSLLKKVALSSVPSTLSINVRSKEIVFCNKVQFASTIVRAYQKGLKKGIKTLRYYQSHKNKKDKQLCTIDTLVGLSPQVDIETVFKVETICFPLSNALPQRLWVAVLKISEKKTWKVQNRFAIILFSTLPPVLQAFISPRERITKQCPISV